MSQSLYFYRPACFQNIHTLILIIALLLTMKIEVYGFTRDCVIVRKNYDYWTTKKLNLYPNNCVRTTLAAVATSAEEDPYETFPLFDKVLFKLFSASVTAEMEKKSDEAPKNYSELMALINEMTLTRSTQRVNDQGKNMLKRLFPPWLLTQYKWMFAAPFPEVLLFPSVSDAQPTCISSIILDSNCISRNILSLHFMIDMSNEM
jgi:hypothetical protein